MRLLLEATRDLLWTTDPERAAEVAYRLVTDLEGTVVDAREAGDDVIPVDVSFGSGPPVVVSPPREPLRRRFLQRHLPGFVRDAHRALELSDRTARLAEDASLDPLTGLSNRRTMGRLLGRLRHDDTLVLLDLDHFKSVNDTLGHQQGDVVLIQFARALRDTARAVDRVGRLGGEEFLVVLGGDAADPFLRRLRARWLECRPHAVTFSAGVAPAAQGPDRSLAAADRALYRAKDAGRDQWAWATEEDYQ